MSAITWGQKPAINNDFYEELGERWYQDDEHLIALLRAEAKLKLSYLAQALSQNFGEAKQQIIDVGCGAGFIANALAAEGHEVLGIDLSASSLAVAVKYAAPGSSVRYKKGDASRIEAPSGSFDVALLLDVLEHVENPEQLIAEAARLVRPGGLIFFHTFNRTQLARFLAIKAVSFVARDSPAHFHVWHLFIKPSELRGMGDRQGLHRFHFQGIRPRVFHWPFWSSVLRRRVHKDFLFDFTSSLALGYIGYALKK